MQLGQDDVTHEPIAELGVLAKRKCDVFENAEVGQERAILKQHPEALAQHVKLSL